MATDEPDPATVEAAARAGYIAAEVNPAHRPYAARRWDALPASHGDREKWAEIIRAALTAAAQPDVDLDAAYASAALDHDPQPAPEADDREALDPMSREKVAARIWREVFAAAERLHRDALLTRRSQPAPRTVTAEWRARLTSEAMEGGGSRAPYTYCEQDEARARRLASRDDYDRLERRAVSEWTEVTDD